MTMPSEKYRGFRDKADLQEGAAQTQDAEARNYRGLQRAASKDGDPETARKYVLKAEKAEGKAAQHRRRAADLLAKAKQVGIYPLEK